MREITITNSDLKVIVDDEDYERISMFSWRLSINYARRWFRSNGKLASVLMHRQIMGEQNPMYDHRDGNGLNNQKENLRPCTGTQNNGNRRINKMPYHSSKYKGVCFHIRKKKWHAGVKFNNHRFHLGTFDNELDAAKAYDRKAEELFGEFANVNFS